MVRLDLAFERPLTTEQRLVLRLALGTLARVSSVRIQRGDRIVTIHGQFLGSRSVRDALAAEGLTPLKITPSLDPEDDALCDDNPEAERVRAIGR